MQRLNVATIVLFAILISTFFGCNEPGDLIDVTAPTIEVDDPAVGDFLEAGQNVPFEAMFTDDQELATYNIEIHENFSGHSHGRVAAANDDPALLKWSFNQSFIIPAGLIIYHATQEDDIEIPINALAGPYHFIVQAIDDAGNATSFQDGSAIEMEVNITNDSQPVINITNLDGDELDLTVGMQFIVEGNVADPTVGDYAGMHAMDITLGEGVHEDEHDHGGRIAADDLMDSYFEDEALDVFMTDGAIVLGTVFEEINFVLSQSQLDELTAEGVDHLVLAIKVYDEQGNIGISNTPVHLQ